MLSLLAYLMLQYLTSDFMSRLVSTPAPVRVKSFQDVLDKGYSVAVLGDAISEAKRALIPRF